MKRDFHRLVTELALLLCFFADRPKQERECKDNRRSYVYQRAINEFLDQWDDVKEERITRWTRKYHEIEEFANIVEEFGDKLFFADRDSKPIRLINNPEWLNIEKIAFRLVGGHNLHEELA